MYPYDPKKTLAQLIKKLEKGREYAGAGGQIVSDAIMVYKGINLLAQMNTFNEDTREWRRQTTNLKTWDTLEIFFTDPNVNKGERSPLEAKGDTQRRYKTSTVYRHPLQKSITRI